MNMEKDGKYKNSLEKEGDVQAAFGRLSRMMRRCAPQTSRLHHGQGRLLWLIDANEGVSPKVLAERMDVRAPSMTEKLERLEEMGFIRREKDEADCRRTRVRITPAGKEELTAFLEERERAGEDFAASLTREERAQFCALCEKLCSGLEEKAAREGLLREERRHGKCEQKCAEHKGHREHGEERGKRR